MLMDMAAALKGTVIESSRGSRGSSIHGTQLPEGRTR